MKQKIFISIHLITIYLFISCAEIKSNRKTVSVENKINLPFSIIKHSNIGIILNEQIKVYDRYKNEIYTVNNVFGELVEIDSVSTLKFDLTNSEERCSLHNFVKVKSNKIDGWIYGNYLFENENTKRDTSFYIKNISFKIIPTKNFGIGAYDEEASELSFCGKGTQSPVILFNGVFNKYEYIPISEIQDAYREKYLTLDNHDGWTDKIKNIEFDENILKIDIERTFQEGFADIEILIELNEKQSFGKVTKYIKRDN